jgi:hypothetical protein
MPESREDSVYLAKLAEQAERYEGKLQTSQNSTEEEDRTARADLTTLFIRTQRWSRT